MNALGSASFYAMSPCCHLLIVANAVYATRDLVFD